jgi:hypothetical protein
VRSRTRRLAAVVSLTSALLLAAAPVTHAQDASGEPSPAASPSAFCAVLTPEEVTDAAGLEVAISAPDSSDTNCTYQADFATGAFFLLDVRIDEGTIQEFKDFFPDVTDVTVGGREAILSEDATLLFIGLDNGILTLQMVGSVGEGIDQAAAIQALGELAVPRVADIPLPTPEPEPTDFPMPSFAGDPELVALFPDLGGEPLEIQSFSGPEIQMMADPEVMATVEETLSGAGRTIEDLSLAFGYNEGGALTAIRVRGADASALLDAFLPLFNESVEEPVMTPTEIAGRSVIEVTDAANEDSPTQYLLASGEVMWQITAQEPALSEVIGALP